MLQGVGSIRYLRNLGAEHHEEVRDYWGSLVKLKSEGRRPAARPARAYILHTTSQAHTFTHCGIALYAVTSCAPRPM